jgi:hypothetical protein
MTVNMRLFFVTFSVFISQTPAFAVDAKDGIPCTEFQGKVTLDSRYTSTANSDGGGVASLELFAFLEDGSGKHIIVDTRKDPTNPSEGGYFAVMPKDHRIFPGSHEEYLGVLTLRATQVTGSGNLELGCK